MSSPDGVLAAAGDLPSWPKIIVGSAAFLALWVGSMAVVIRLSTGTWGGTQADPIWVGPVAAGSGLVASIVIATLAYAGHIWREGMADQQSDADVKAIAAALYMRMAARGGPLTPQPRPIRVPVLTSPLKAVVFTGDEPYVMAPIETREILPAHFRHPFAVYETRPGQYSVMHNGEAWGQPFETTDPDLASEVCDTWAKEFGPE